MKKQLPETIPHQVDHLLNAARNGDIDTAFHVLRELALASVSALTEAYSAEIDPAVRVVIVRAIREHRLPSTVGFFAAAIRDSNAEVWKEGLDGLVSIATPEARQVLENAINGPVDTTRKEWFAEAIGQITNAIDSRGG
jgi:hypothetical protein